jgi:hypothetical protein
MLRRAAAASVVARDQLGVRGGADEEAVYGALRFDTTV